MIRKVENGLEALIMQERLELARERIRQIPSEEKASFLSGFLSETAVYLDRLFSLCQEAQGFFIGQRQCSDALWQYGKRLPALEERWMRVITLLAEEWRGLIPAVYRGKTEILLIYSELYLQIYGAVQALWESPDELYGDLKDSLYWFYFDNAAFFVKDLAEDLFGKDQERERIVALDRKDFSYLYASGAKINGAARARAVYYGLCDQAQLELEARNLLSLAELPARGVCYLGFLPGMEPLGAACIKEYETRGGQMRLFYQREYLPVRNPSFFSDAGVCMWDEAECPSPDDEFLILTPDYRERKIECWKAALKTYQKPEQPAYTLFLQEEFPDETGEEGQARSGRKFSKARIRLVHEADGAITRMLSDYIYLQEPVVLKKGVS